MKNENEIEGVFLLIHDHQKEERQPPNKEWQRFDSVVQEVYFPCRAKRNVFSF